MEQLHDEGKLDSFSVMFGGANVLHVFVQRLLSRTPSPQAKTARKPRRDAEKKRQARDASKPKRAAGAATRRAKAGTPAKKPSKR
jgi:hypothetical protein